MTGLTDKFEGYSKKVIEVAHKRATKKTVKWFQSQVAKIVSKTSGMKQKDIKGRVIANIAEGYIWVGLNDVSAHKFGKGRKGSEGVTNKAGLHKGAFNASMNNGKSELIMVRLTKKRLPIERVSVEVRDDIILACRKVEKLAIKRHEEIMKQELNYAANHEKR